MVHQTSRALFQIGEFSRITGLTVKAIHLYHERRLLVPAFIDPESGYRLFDRTNVERARAVVALRELSFSLEEIAELLAGEGDDTSLLRILTTKRDRIEAQAAHLKRASATLGAWIRQEQEMQAMAEKTEVNPEEKQLPVLVVACRRWKGCYQDTGAVFGALCRAVGRHAAGPPLNLYHDGEYKSDDADIESCVPIRAGCRIGADGLSVRELAGGRAVTMIHRGSYEHLGRTYEKVFAHIHEKGYKPVLPTREVYLKGPGMIFRGNPQKYVTEIQVPISG